MAYESGLHIRLAVHAAATAEELAQKAMSKGIHILPVKAAESSSPEILLSFAGIAEEDIEPALLELKKYGSYKKCSLVSTQLTKRAFYFI